MVLNKNSSRSNNGELITFAITAAIFGVISIFSGFILAPVVAALYAGMILVDKTKLKLPSIVFPILILGLNFLIKGKFDIDGIVFIPVAVLLFLLYRSGASKGGAAFWMTVCYTLSVFLILITYGFKNSGATDLSGVVEFYQQTVYSFKNKFIDALMSISQSSQNGEVYYPISYDVANEFFTSLLELFPALIISLSFIFTGITIKLFDGSLMLYSKGFVRDDWKLRIPTPIAVFYLLIIVASLFVTRGFVALTVKWAELVLSLVFAYFGFGLVTSLLGMKKGKGFAYTMVLLAFLLLGGALISILSYIGIYITFVLNGAEKDEES